MPERMPPDDDPIIRGLREAGIRPLRPPGPRDALPIGRPVLILIGIVLLVLALVPFLAGRLADWLWYRETGFERVFLTKVVAQWALGIPTALVPSSTGTRVSRFAETRVGSVRRYHRLGRERNCGTWRTCWSRAVLAR